MKSSERVIYNRVSLVLEILSLTSFAPKRRGVFASYDKRKIRIKACPEPSVFLVAVFEITPPNPSQTNSNHFGLLRTAHILYDQCGIIYTKKENPK